MFMMKNYSKKISRLLLIVTISIITGLQSFSQVNDSLRMQYDSLDTKYFPTGILYNRSTHFLYCWKFDSIAHQWNKDTSFTSSPYNYEAGNFNFKKSVYDFMYNDMLYSCNNDTILIQPDAYHINDSISKLTHDFPISLMHIQYNTLDPNAIKLGYITYDTNDNVYTLIPDTLWINDSIYSVNNNPDSSAYLAFEQNELNAAISTRSVLYKKFNSGIIKDSTNSYNWYLQLNINYNLPKSLFIHNDGIAYPDVKIDFDDGNGFVDVNWNSSISVTYNDTVLSQGGYPNYSYSKKYIKNIKVKYPQLSYDVIMGFDVAIIGMYAQEDTIIMTSTLGFDCPINEPNYSPSEGRVSIRYADSKFRKITKPIIVVEGFESALKDYGIIGYHGIVSGHIIDEDMNEQYPWLNEMRFLFDSLHDNGYDIIYVDHKDPKTWIQNNGLSVIKVIQYVNTQLKINGSNEKTIVMGASMGGLIVRYALRKMELDTCCHNTRLYVTFDTPHQGANIPPGIQHFVNDLGRHINDDAKESYEKAINSPAARQMLVYHIESSAATDRYNWQHLMDSIGHPQNCRQIALISGSEQGTAYLLNSPGDQLLQMRITFPMPYMYTTSLNTPSKNWSTIKNDTYLVNFNAYSESQSTVYYANTPSVALKNITYAWLLYGVTAISFTVADAIAIPNPPYLPPVSLFKIGAKTINNSMLSNFYQNSMATHSYSNNPYPLNYTSAPGGLSNTQEGIEKSGVVFGWLFGGFKTLKANSDKHSFIPSVSALDMHTTDLYQNIKTNYLANQAITEFDCYWATLRNDNSPLTNMMHVGINIDNRNWIQEQILADWELRAANGEYNGVLTGYYNYGRPGIHDQNIEYINQPYQTILYSLDIENNGVLYVNKQDVIGLSTGVLLPRHGSTFKLKTNCDACDTTVVRIKTGGQFVVGDLNNGILNKGEVHFCKNAQLEIFSNGQLIIKDSSRLIIEEGASLVIHNGAYILLDGPNAVLEIRGKIVIDDNSTLEPLGDGFIRFAAKMGTTNYNDFWDVGHNSSMVIASSGATAIKKAEVIENLYIPDSLNQYYQNAIIEIDSMIAIYSYGSIQAQNAIFTAMDTTKFYRSVSVFGQPNTRFGSCRFEFGNMGLYAAMGSGGNTITLDTCTFTKNYIGLYTMDQYISMDYCNASYNLDYGWVAAAMQGNCNATQSQFNNNGYSGIKFDSQLGVALVLRDAELNDNYQHGVEIESGVLQANCSEFMRNGQAGIYAKENSEINLSVNSKNAIRFNTTGILFNMAKSIRLEDGYNDFSSNQYYLIGEMMPDNYYIPNTSPYGIDIDNNLMPATFYTGVNTLPVNLYFYDPQHTASYQMPINGWTQNMNSLQCICISAYIAPNYDNYKAFEGLTSSSVIHTPMFPNTYLADALKSAAMQMSYGDAYTGNDTLAIAQFKEIFDTIPPSITDDEQWAVDHALGLMITALTNAIEHELIDPNRAMDGMPVDEYVAMIADEIQQRLNDVDYASQYAAEQEAYYQLLMAQMYRAAEHYDYALSILQNDNYFFNTTLQNQADYWNCICNAENQLLKGTIERSQYELQIDSCHEMSTARRAMFMPMFGSTIVNQDAKENQILGIYPNPAEQLIAVEFTKSVSMVRVQLSDLSGRLIWETTKTVNGKQLRLKLPKVSSGTYMLKTITVNQVFNNKIIIK